MSVVEFMQNLQRGVLKKRATRRRDADLDLLDCLDPLWWTVGIASTSKKPKPQTLDPKP